MFFFFQAEDGIRDSSVTGVQMCALPIYQTTLSVFPRLAQDAQPDAGDTHGQVHWQADGELVEQTGGPGQVWLYLQADAVGPMVCPRCLAPAPITQIGRAHA